MLDIGFMEILVIGAIALIVVGPKDLPGLLRTVGQYVGKARAMARDFQRTMDEAAREADLGDVADVVKNKGKMSDLPFDNQIVDTLKDFEKTVKSETTGAMRAADAATSSAASTAAPTAATPGAAAASGAAAVAAANAAAAAGPAWTKSSQNTSPTAPAPAPVPVPASATPAEGDAPAPAAADAASDAAKSA